MRVPVVCALPVNVNILLLDRPVLGDQVIPSPIYLLVKLRESDLVS